MKNVLKKMKSTILRETQSANQPPKGRPRASSSPAPLARFQNSDEDDDDRVPFALDDPFAVIPPNSATTFIDPSPHSSLSSSQSTVYSGYSFSSYFIDPESRSVRSSTSSTTLPRVPELPPKPETTLATIPPEIISQIIKYSTASSSRLHYDYRRLANLALVNTTFAAQSQSLLFRNVRLQDGVKAAKFMRSISDSKRLRGYVVRLAIEDEKWFPDYWTNAPKELSIILTPDIIIEQILRLCPSIKRARLELRKHIFRLDKLSSGRSELLPFHPHHSQLTGFSQTSNSCTCAPPSSLFKSTPSPVWASRVSDTSTSPSSLSSITPQMNGSRS
ncbi:hypothetical protein T439DRAFT_243450 [Meredithblackwellia eburnea MCA 4105]